MPANFAEPAPLAEHSDEHDSYAVFLDAVARAQLDAWLPPWPARVLDISRGVDLAGHVAAAGHFVCRVEPAKPAGRPHPMAFDDGRLAAVIGDARSLDWFRPGSVDVVLAEGRALSYCLAAETTVAQAADILRTGGRLLLSVDSLLLGLARLAEQHRWPELADAPAADVVLVPESDGGASRCFGPEELRDLLAEAGLDVDWVRPRTVLPPEAVAHALTAERATDGADSPTALDAAALDELVRSELALAARNEGEAVGMRLVASAVKR